MIMEMSLDSNCSLKQDSVLKLSQSFGETSGDIPIYSLHKIKRWMKANPIRINHDLRMLLTKQLIAENRKYRAESGNQWNCLTSNNLVSAVNSIDQYLLKNINGGSADLANHAEELAANLKERLLEKKNEVIKTIKKWFRNNYDLLHYGMDGKIPWAIVKRLQANLSVWILKNSNPFSQDINEMVLDVAREDKDYEGNDPEVAWELMGGTVFTKKRKKK